MTKKKGATRTILDLFGKMTNEEQKVIEKAHEIKRRRKKQMPPIIIGGEYGSQAPVRQACQ